jgi:hypothetical protein
LENPPPHVGRYGPFRILKLLLVCTLFALAASPAGALDQDLLRFVAAKEAQARELGKAQTNKVPSIVWSFFDAVRVDDWETATNLGERLEQASGRQAATGEPAVSPALQTAIWSPITEIIGAYDAFHEWNNKWLHRFGREIIDSIPKGSIYFGGTDPGRFIISALSESQRDGRPFFTLTQNQLADMTYLEYLRTMYGNKIQIPTAGDSLKAFQEYVADVGQRLKEGRLKPGEDVKMVDGKIQVTGQVAVMEINALLVKSIFQKNPDREFYVEESFSLDWMYSYLSPHGLIFKLHSKPLTELRVETVQQDQDYWRRFTGELIGNWLTEKTTVKEVCDFGEKVYLHKDLSGFKGDAGFAGNDESQKCFSKLRSAIAGLYVWRGGQAKDEDEKARMRQAADLAYRQALALCPYSPEAAFRYAQLLENLKRHDDAVRVAETLLRHDPNDASAQGLVRQLRKAD